MTGVLGIRGGGDDWLGRADPRAKLAPLVATMVLAIAYDKPEPLAVLLLGTTAVAASSRVSLRSLASGLRPLLPIALFAGSLRVIFTPGGTTLIDAGWLAVSDRGLLEGAALAIRLLLMGEVVAVWAGTTHPSDMVEGLVRLGLPRSAGMALVLALRMIPRLQESYHDITRAQRARGLVLEGSWGWRRVERLMPVMVSLVIASLRSAQAWGVALEARGFSGERQPRGQWRVLAMSSSDWALIALAVAGTAAGIALL